MELNIEQKQAKEKIISFLNSDKTGYFGVYGAGGTGKTFLIANIVNEYNHGVTFLGATNKVKNVLKESLKNSGYKKQANIKTIDSFLKFKIEKDHENKPTVTYKFPSPSEIPSLIVIDEISLISFQKFCLIERLKDKCKFILLGDYLQLPPIEEDYNNIVRNAEGFQVSKIFTSIPLENTFTLTIQNRQKTDSDLGKMIIGFRNNMHLKIPPKLLASKKSNNKDILFYDINDKELKEVIKNNECTAVCFKNLSVLSFNWLIGSTKSMRKDYRLNENNINDTLMFDQFYIHKKNNVETKYYTSNIIKIVDIEKNIEEKFIVKDKIVKTITYNKLHIIDSDGSNAIIRYIHGGLYGMNGGGLSSSVYGQRKTYLEHIKKGKNVNENKNYLKDLNNRFSDYQNSFAKLKKPYAITCHKAQGSTYNTVIIPVYDYFMLNHKDANQLLYVALSRAKEKIIFVDKKNQFDETTKRKLFSEFEKNSIASNNDYKCNNCRKTLVDREFECDHIIPLANGGKNTVENLQALCKNCHKNKTSIEIYGKK
jgi:hypothetical protein